MFETKSLTVSVDKQIILDQVSLQVESGQVVVLMGPNASGKSSFLYAIMGHPSYPVQSGDVCFGGQSLLSFSVEQRARLGLLLIPQQAVAVPGVTIETFLRESFHALHPDESTAQFHTLLEQGLLVLSLDQSFLRREVHEGFSGGEKKRFELLQMLVLLPLMVILDEIDSGLDVDAIVLVLEALAYYRTMVPQAGILLITHYQQLLSRMKTDKVYVLIKGSIVAAGDDTLAHYIGMHGYETFIQGSIPTDFQTGAGA